MNRLSIFDERQNNRSMIIQNIVIQERVKQMMLELIGGYNIEFK